MIVSVFFAFVFSVFFCSCPAYQLFNASLIFSSFNGVQCPLYSFRTLWSSSCHSDLRIPFLVDENLPPSKVFLYYDKGNSILNQFCFTTFFSIFIDSLRPQKFQHLLCAFSWVFHTCFTSRTYTILYSKRYSPHIDINTSAAIEVQDTGVGWIERVVKLHCQNPRPNSCLLVVVPEMW